MTQYRNPLCAIEQFAIAEEVASLARHDLRNRLGAIRNASYFLQRRVGTTELWNEPRVPKFFSLIETEIVAADAVIQAKLTFAGQAERPVGVIPLARCIDLAASASRVASAAVEVIPGDDALVNGEVEELALAIRALIENGAESREGARVQVAARLVGGAVRISVVDDGPGIADFESSIQPMVTTKPGRLGLGLGIALRAVRRRGGSLSIEPSVSGAHVVLELPAVER